MSVLNATIVATASIASHQRIDVKAAIDNVIDIRRNFISVAFPYVSMSKKKSKDEEYDAYFDELDERAKARKEKESAEKAKPEAAQTASEEASGQPNMV